MQLVQTTYFHLDLLNVPRSGGSLSDYDTTGGICQYYSGFIRVIWTHDLFSVQCRDARPKEKTHLWLGRKTTPTFIQNT